MANLCEKLIRVIYDGDLKRVRELLSKGVDVNEYVDGWARVTPLMYVARYGRTDIIAATLIKAGADVNACDEHGITVLMYAAKNGHTSIVDLLIKSNVHLDAQDSNGKTALMHAVWIGHKEAVEILLRAGANVTIQDNDGKTALDIARDSGDPKMVALIENEVEKQHTEIAEVKTQSRVKTALQNIKKFIRGHREMQSLLDQEFRKAAYNDDLESLQILLDLGVNVNATDMHGNTPLMHAVLGGSEKCIPALLDAGADTSIENIDKETAYSLAKNHAHFKIAILLENAAKKQKTQVIAGKIGNSAENANEIHKAENKEQAKEKQKVAGQEMTEEEQIAYYINNGRTFTLHGASGSGKTARIRAIDPDMTIVAFWNEAVEEDVIGKDVPLIAKAEQSEKNKSTVVREWTEWMAPSWYTELCRKAKAEPNKKHVLFIDEVTNATEALQSTIQRLVVNREVKEGKGKLPDNVSIVLAENNTEASRAAYNAKEPLFQQMRGFIYGDVYLKDSIEDWIEWGSREKEGTKGRRNLHPLVAGFIAREGERVFQGNDANDEEVSQEVLTAREWEQVSDIIYDNGGQVRRELMQNKLGSGLAAEFMSYTQKPLLTLEEVMAGKYETKDIPEKTEEKLALVCELRGAKQEEFKKVREFVEKNMGSEYAKQYVHLWVEGHKNGQVKLVQKNVINGHIVAKEASRGARVN